MRVFLDICRLQLCFGQKEGQTNASYWSQHYPNITPTCSDMSPERSRNDPRMISKMIGSNTTPK